MWFYIVACVMCSIGSAEKSYPIFPTEESCVAAAIDTAKSWHFLTGKDYHYNCRKDTKIPEFVPKRDQSL